MDYERKFREMQVYLPFLEDRIDRVKKHKLRSNYHDPKREQHLTRLQNIYKILKDPIKRVTFSTLEKFETVIKKIQEQDFLESRKSGSDKDSLPKRDLLNPYHNPEAVYRPPSSCSNASSNSSNTYRPAPPRKMFDDTPASPSPPHSPAQHHGSSSSIGPIIIPTERRGNNLYPAIVELPPVTAAPDRRKHSYLFAPSPPPPPIPNVVPITRVDINELEPQDWDTDEDENAPKKKEIIVPKPDPVILPKKDEDRFVRKDIPMPTGVPPVMRDFDMKHPSDNIPTVQVNALGGSRRLKSVIEKTNLLKSDLNRIFTGHHQPGSPHVDDMGLRSPDPTMDPHHHHVRHASPAASSSSSSSVHAQPFSPSRRDKGPVPMATPSLLLNAPPTSSKMPIAIDDIAEYLDDSERSNLRKQQLQPRLASRHPMGMPNSSPVMVSPRSDAAPCITDPRVSNDPRHRPNADPRTAAPGDPRTAHGGMAPNDPRLPRYADNYERHKRTMPQENQPPTQQHQPPPQADFQRHPPFGPENPNMVPPMSNVPGPGPGPYGPHGQMGPMGYNYPMGPPGHQGPPGPPVQQQWNVPPGSHMQQPGPPMPPYGPMPPQGPPQQWGPQGPPGMYPDMQQGHPGMNGDARMGGGYPGQMGPGNMPRNIPPLMNNSGGQYGMGPGGPGGSKKYPSYPDAPFDQQQQQSQRPPWGGDRFSNRPNTPFSRPPNSWGGKDGGPPQRPPNRDPRVIDRDPRTRPEPPHQHRPATPPATKGPPPGKEVHPNKLKQQQAQEKDAASKKRLDHHKPDLNKFKEKDKGKDKDKEKEKSRVKHTETMNSPLTNLYGVVDAKKAIQGTGLQKFKIPKKRPSVETRPDPTPSTEDNYDEDDVVTSSSASHEPAIKTKSESSTSSKRSGKLNEKEKSKGNEKSSDKKEKSAESKKTKGGIEKIDILNSLMDKDVLPNNLSKEDVSSIVEALVKKLKKQKSKKSVIYSSDEEDHEENENEASSCDERRSSSSTKKAMKKKKKPSARQIIESSEESEASAESIPEIVPKKDKETKFSLTKKTLEIKLEDVEKKKKKEKEKEKKKEKDKENLTEKEKDKVKEKENEKALEGIVPERKSPRKKNVKDTVPESDKDGESTAEPTTVPETPVESEEVTESTTEPVVEAPVKPAKPKRRFRELDMLQEDLKSSWICDGAMKATGSRTCSQKNKQQEQQADLTSSSSAIDEDSGTSPATKGASVRSARAGSSKANTAQQLSKRKMKKPQPPKSKAKSKKAQAAAAAAAAAAAVASEETSLPATSESEEDDLPLSRRSESTKLSAKGKMKSVPPPPLFDSSSNDSFNLDPSAVEAATDISLHPDTSAGEKPLTRGKGLKRGPKRSTDAAADSSSDESFVSNTSSTLLLDTTSKQRDNNEELLDDVMAELATNPKYSVAKKKQVKKKKNNWQMGILSKKKKKKATAAIKADDSLSLDSTADTSLAIDDTSSNKDHDTSTSNEKNQNKTSSALNRTESLDHLNAENEEETGSNNTSWRASATANAEDNDDEDYTSRVDAEALIGYTLAGNEKYQCLLCPFYRKNIVHHYKMQHPRKEVLISRLAVAEANIAIEESRRLNFENNESPPLDTEVGKYSCRFCGFTTKGVDSIARESFYEHCTNHTGEYRFGCQNCNYKAAAKGSIRTHYYKECRKYGTLKNLNEAIVEDPLPPDDRIYGYLCSKCNFIQLKKANVEKHVKTWHKEGEIKVIKIDMSLNLKKEEYGTKVETASADAIVPHKVELKDEGEAATVNKTELTFVKDDIKVGVVGEGIMDEGTLDDDDAIDEAAAEDEDEVHVTLEATEHRAESKPDKKEKNLSAFVCANEQETKDAEIQNERKQKMREIAENIGIKVDKEEAQKRLSILDKLKDKMVIPVEEEIEPVVAHQEEPMIDPSEIKPPEGAAADEVQDPLHIPEQSAEDEAPEEKPVVTEVMKVKDDPEGGEKDDKASTKMKDPLSYVNEPAKPIGSDEEHSDGEQTAAPVQYDSDTSAEQSDNETDVDSILKNSKDMGSPSKGHMMTTIQRLAAQLQNTKSLETPPPAPPMPEPENMTADIPMPMIIKTEKISPKKTADDMAILSPTRIKNEVKKEPGSPPQVKPDEPKQNSPKKFIRIRRISGDKLSKGADVEGSNNENDQFITSMATIEPIDSNANDSFLKIANVVSLSASKESDNHIVSNIRKAVETSPHKVKGLSVLKNTNSSFILKRVDSSGTVVTQSGETMKLIPLNIPPTSRAMSKTENYISIGGQPAMAIKIDSKGVAVPLSMASNTSTTNLVNSNQPIKVVTIAAPEQVSVAIKLKSANVYEKMLKDDKLIHMYKCMGRDCSFTTSSEPAFLKHIRIHEDDNKSNKLNNEPKDYFKCAYCYIDCNNYDVLMQHLKKMHTFCRFCCKYCFYRAFAHSYVEIHQKTYHPHQSITILAASEELVHMPPSPQRLDRKQIIKPYVCVHECNKYFFIPEAFVLHLNMHHTNIVSGFKCHLCQIIVASVDNLIEHYKQHGYYKYHCMYCPHGSATIKDLHVHLSSAHYNQPAQVLERCLPREISKNLSAIEQLRVRDVDLFYKQRKAICNEEEQNIKVAIPPLSKSSVTILQNSSTVTAKMFSSKDGSGGGTLVPVANLDGGVSNIRIVDARSLNSGTSLLNIGKNIKVTTTDASKMNNSGKFQMFDEDGNEYITTNLLDRSDLLIGNKNKVKINNRPKVQLDSDSDIEIIEDYTTIPKDSSKDKEHIKKEEPSIKEETSDSLAGELDPNINLFSSTPNSAPSTPKPTLGESPNANTNRFLTLDDVRGTGFSGHELYRCGVDSCKYSAETAEELRQHMQKCSPTDEENSIGDSALYCVHCGPLSKRFGKPSFFIDHLKTHGLKRFGCGICNARFAVQSQAQSHLRAKHKYVNSKIVPADPMNPAPDGLFVIHPQSNAEKLKSKKLRTPEKDQTKFAEMEKTTFAPSEIGNLPLQAIFLRPVQCAVCPYNNKVRTNIVRHLQAHLKDETVPDSSPVNPVPCLDKKERMFDKMVNLASSSHENGRMSGAGNGGGKKEEKVEDEAMLPKYVPENKRYVCGVPECNYLTVEEAMLRHHLKALHSDEVYFRCPHCPPPNGQDPGQNVPLDKMGVHLKMHDSRLYKCSHCIYHHHHRHLVERHLTDKHPEKRPFVKVIRELQLEEDKQSAGEGEEAELPDPDGNTWKCNLCDFKCMLKAAMQNHAAIAHDERCQYKCNSCGFKAISKLTLEQHLATKHLTEPGVDYTTVYQRIRGLKKPEPTEALACQDEPFDTTPLWRRDMPRIRHIRGILLEEEEENGKAASKRKIAAVAGAGTEADGSKPAKLKAGGKSSSLDDCKSPEAKKARPSLDISELRQPDGTYGPYGAPVGEQYACPLCSHVKTKYKQDFRDHLYRDLKYMRWLCPACDYKAITRGALVKHLANRHPGENLESQLASPNPEIEEWVAAVITSQMNIMKSNKVAALAVEEEEDGESDDDDLVIDTKEEDDNEVSDEEKGSSELLPAPLICKHCSMSFIKWRGFKRHVQLKHLKRLGFLCAYCDRSTNSEAVMLQHVRSKHREMPEKIVTNPNPSKSELTAEFWEREYGLVVPKRTKKRKRQDALDDRLNQGSPKLDADQLACEKCDFMSTTPVGLKSHMKTHETRIKQKCSYCTFSSFNLTEMRQHWDVNHAHLDFKVEEAFVTTSVMEPTGPRAAKKTKLDDDKKATVYYCYYCEMGSTSLDAIRSHWRMMHMEDSKSVIFKYREHSEPKVKCAYCAEPGTKSIIANHIWQKHGSDKAVLLVEREEDGWLCKWCVLKLDDVSKRCQEEFLTTKEEIDQHQKLYHSHLRWNYQLVRRSFSCKQCNFDVVSLEVMQKHAKSHVNVYKCKYCTDMFKTFTSVKTHFRTAHPNRDPETRTITSDDLSKEIDNVIMESSRYSELQLKPAKIAPVPPIKTPPTSPRLAKKSTTKQSLTPVKPQPVKLKAVARKSTNPLPRYPKGLVFEIEENTREEERPRYVSYYGRPLSPIDLSSVTTEVIAARMKMKVTCDKLGEYFKMNIDPSLRIKDFMKTGKGNR